MVNYMREAELGLESPAKEAKVESKVLEAKDFSIYQDRIEGFFKEAEKEKNTEKRRQRFEKALNYVRTGLQGTNDSLQVVYFIGRLAKAQDELVKMAYADGKKASAVIKADLQKNNMQFTAKLLGKFEENFDAEYNALFPEKGDKDSNTALIVKKIEDQKK